MARATQSEWRSKCGAWLLSADARHDVRPQIRARFTEKRESVLRTPTGVCGWTVCLCLYV